MKKRTKGILWGAGAAAALVLLAAVGYLAYLFFGYSRIPDMQPLQPLSLWGDTMQAGEPYRAVTWNIGFGAYEDEYSFFMDGGEHSWALSPEALDENLTDIVSELRDLEADFLLMQEVDMDADRSYHVDECYRLINSFPTHDAVFAINYDSDYLFYPFHQPHGKSLAGLLTLSDPAVESGLRVSLPVEGGVQKFLDLDRCFSVSYIPVDNGRSLCLYNVHLSAYTRDPADPAIVNEQLDKLYASFREEMEKGNYIICGGDFNKDLTGRAEELFCEESVGESWAKPFPAEGLPAGISLPIAEGEDLRPTCRNADAPYDPDTTYVTYVDGFLVSDNVQVAGLRVEDTAFRYSDHQPVVLDFRLIP